MHNSNMYFCLVSKGNPEYKIIIILFMRFPFSIVLYEVSPYSLYELKYCSYKTAQTQSQWELVFMMVSFPWLYWFFWLSVAQIIVSTPWFCLLCLIQKDLLGGINYPSRKTYHSYKLQRFHFRWLDWSWGQIFIFLCDFNHWIFLLIGQLLMYSVHSLCNILICKGKSLVVSHDDLYSEVSFHLNFSHCYNSRGQSLWYLHPFFCKCGGLILTSNLREADHGSLMVVPGCQVLSKIL